MTGGYIIYEGYLAVAVLHLQRGQDSSRKETVHEFNERKREGYKQ